ncbi:MAG: hypothetical protein LM593_01890 [Candidatus Verstraetearchaeota archaeon]|jgi:predicted transcriptional regulator|nr:hypothetical protein [Candidatus Verstraetearchaeota archaeon]
MHVYEISSSMQLLITLHNMSAVRPESAKSFDEIKCNCCIDEKELYLAIRELINYGYIIEKNGLYYLSSLGISVVRSIFT